MSQSQQRGGRGFGRAGRGFDPKKGSARSKPTSSTGGRARARGSPQPSTSQQQVAEPKIGLPQQSASVEDITKKAAALKIQEKPGAESGDSQAGGRGGTRGKKKIPVVNLLTTKPLTCESKSGTKGRALELVTNYFKVDSTPNWVLFQYKVDFNVEEERERVLRSYLKQHEDKLRTSYIFDGGVMFTSQRLTAGDQPLHLTSLRDGDNFPVQITIRLIQQLQYGNSVYLQIFNILVRRCLHHLKLHLVQRNFYDPLASIQLRQHNLEIWPGYLTSIRQHEYNILMCADTSHKVMRTDTAFKILNDCKAETADYKKLYQQVMIGAIILTDYNNKTYRVDDIDFDSTPESKFKYKDGRETTYVEYYKTRYQIRIKNMKQPLLVSRVQQRFSGVSTQCLLIPELCRMTGLSSKMLENRLLMKDLADITRLSPSDRMQKLVAFNSRLQNEPAVMEDFRNWGLKINKNLLRVPGREYEPETIFGGQSESYNGGQDVDWTKLMRTKPMFVTARFNSFLIICPAKMRREVEDFAGAMIRAGQGMHFRIPRPVIIESRTDSPGELLDLMEGSLGQHAPDLVMFGVFNDRNDRYSMIKKKCFVDRAIPSQVILSKTTKAKGVMSIATKVAVQINCKLGGAPWTVQIPTEGLMVIGYDVCHDKSKKCKSVGAIVASLNRPMTSWFSTATKHTSGEEISTALPAEINRALQRYKAYNGNRLPTKILLYRDGVGEGQIDHVYNQEVVNMKRMLTDVYGGETWKMAYIIVTKRIRTRFFLNGGNPHPGTIVDDIVTLPEFYDFYLISQSVRQGTVSPTSYNVISDNTGWAPDHIQRLTYKLTHLYYNCSSTVRVPAPCQYAHKLAFMVSQNLSTKPHPSLCDSLFYL